MQCLLLSLNPAPEFLHLSFLTDTYGPAVVKMLKTLKGRECDPSILRQFIENARQRIQIGFPSPPDQPQDWSREGSLSCNCEFCTQVNQFLPDPLRREITFYKTLKRNMTHVESEIQKSQVDLDVEIRKTPPKFQGTFRKNQNSYEQKLSLFNRAQGILKDLQIEDNAAAS